MGKEGDLLKAVKNNDHNKLQVIITYTCVIKQEVYVTGKMYICIK